MSRKMFDTNFNFFYHYGKSRKVFNMPGIYQRFFKINVVGRNLLYTSSSHFIVKIIVLFH